MQSRQDYKDEKLKNKDSHQLVIRAGDNELCFYQLWYNTKYILRKRKYKLLIGIMFLYFLLCIY